MIILPKKKTFYKVIISTGFLFSIALLLFITNKLKSYTFTQFPLQEQQEQKVLYLRNLQSQDNKNQPNENYNNDLNDKNLQKIIPSQQSTQDGDYINQDQNSQTILNQNLNAFVQDGEQNKQIIQEDNECPEKGTDNVFLIIIYIFLTFYMILGLAVICDDFFVPALDKIGIQMNLSPDVVGATLMAIGGDAPEFFTGLIGTFKQSDVGSGTIVGSLTFNLFFVMGACVLLTNQTLKLTWYPFARDSIFYILSLVILVFSAGVWSPNQIEWWESLAMLALYGLYLVYMMNNAKFEKQFTGTNASEQQFLINQQLNELERQKPSLLQQKYSQQGGQRPSVRSVARSIQEEEEQSTAGYIFALLAWPLIMCFKLTIPSPSEKTWLSFTISILEIGIMSYIMVYAAEIAGNSLGIPEIVMGITILAAGTSVTDLLTSIIVYRKGFGDMAMSSAFGSNIFDIIVCLPFPWLIYSVFTGKSVQIQAGNLNESLIIILAMQFLLMIVFRWTNQVFDKKMGYFMLFLYFFYLAHYLITTDWKC